MGQSYLSRLGWLADGLFMSRTARGGSNRSERKKMAFHEAFECFWPHFLRKVRQLHPRNGLLRRLAIDGVDTFPLNTEQLVQMAEKSLS